MCGNIRILKGGTVKFLIVSFLLFFSALTYPENIQIKSMQVYAGRDQLAFPVLSMKNGGPNYLTIAFDIQSKFQPNLIILFRYCDRNWKPYDNIFLTNQGKNIKYNLSYYTLPNTVKDAHYHYRGTFPDSRGDVDFPYSGKWKFYVTDSQDTSLVYASGKFYVVYDTMSLKLTLRKEQLEDKVYFPSDLAKIFNVTAEFNLPDDLYPSNVEQVEIVDNHKIDYPIIVDRSFNTNQRQYYWDGNRKFSFTARDIQPGNEYREVDTRNINKFTGKNVNAQFDGLEYSRFFKLGPPDMNGGELPMFFNNPDATYMNVKFSIRPPKALSESVFIVGAFNNWKVSPRYELSDDYGVYSISLSLKRGVYDYQYVTGYVQDGEVDDLNWTLLEGNDWDTTNSYYVFVYYNDPNYGGYDRIIAYQKITSR